MTRTSDPTSAAIYAEAMKEPCPACLAAAGEECRQWCLSWEDPENGTAPGPDREGQDQGQASTQQSEPPDYRRHQDSPQQNPT